MNNIVEVSETAVRVGYRVLLSYEKEREDTIARYEGQLEKLRQSPDVDADKLLHSAFRHEERIKVADRKIKYLKKLLVQWNAPEAT